MTARFKRIDFIRGFGSFRDWECSSEVPDFARYNLIYGWNGSGKSMLARLIRAFEMERLPDFAEPGVCDFKIELSGSSSLRPGDIAGSGLAVRVFSEDFVEENLQFDKASVSALLILGEKRIEAAKEHEELREMLDVVIAKHEKAQAELSATLSSRDRLLSDTALRIKERLRVGPDQRFHYYDKRDVEAALLRIPEDTERPDIDADAEAGRFNSIPLSPLDIEQNPEINQLPALWTELVDVLSADIVGEVIEDLRAEPDVQRWVECGVVLHEGRDEQCLFCDQRLPLARIEHLRGHFSSQFTQHVASITALTGKFEVLRSETDEYGRSIVTIQDELLYSDLLGGWAWSRHRLERALVLVDKVVACALEALTTKRSDPWRKRAAPIQLNRITSIVNRVEAAIAAMGEESDAHATRRRSGDEVRSDAQQSLDGSYVGGGWRNRCGSWVSWVWGLSFLSTTALWGWRC